MSKIKKINDQIEKEEESHRKKLKGVKYSFSAKKAISPQFQFCPLAVKEKDSNGYEQDAERDHRRKWEEKGHMIQTEGDDLERYQNNMNYCR